MSGAIRESGGQRTLQCMEVWGGNRAVQNGVSMPGLDAWVFSRPWKDQPGGGDVHYVSSCATGRITRLLVADVSGHGEAIAGAAGSLRDLMRRYINFVDQGKFVESLNREFGARAEAGCFATAVVATFFAPTGELAACNAGHPRPLHYSARAGRWGFLDQPLASGGSEVARAADDERRLVNLPLGIAEPTAYEPFSRRLRPGDLVLFYTDAMIEARGPGGRMLGEKGLLELVGASDISSPMALIDDVYSRLLDCCPGREPDDDVTMLLVRPNGLAPRATMRGSLAAGWRVARGVAGGLLGRGPLPWPELSARNILGSGIGWFNRAPGSGRGTLAE
ncbi:MAG TPA: PP2C family protein-serine/threonine phosphatase [Phycisphaerales bacterium]|nr:PP2C family protein-serine/threonine phosphatase [Phycisphaerales bacterium]